MTPKTKTIITFSLAALAALASCSRGLGWGILLWSSEDPPIPSGTPLPVYIRSNIDQVYVAGIPREYRRPGSKIDKFEVPLSKLELAGSRRRALARAKEFAPYAASYAETLQDGLPIRSDPENGSRRVYRLRQGEIVKILAAVEGVPAVGASGDPLPGEWYRVLTEDGSAGYCFSYRLRLFEHTGGPLVAAPAQTIDVTDSDLDRLLSLSWTPESYAVMTGSSRIDLSQLARHYGFHPGADTGTARIYIDGLDKSFTHSGIRALGGRSWRFEGAPLQMTLRSDTVLAVQYNEEGGAQRALLFTALPQPVDDIIVQETARREALFRRILTQGPAFTSHNYGLLTFLEDERFTWTGSDLLVPQVIPPSALEKGSVNMGLFLSAPLEGQYDGALSFRFDGAGGAASLVSFLYTLDAQGLRLEYVPPANIDGVTVTRRSPSPTVLYFYKNSESY